MAWIIKKKKKNHKFFFYRLSIERGQKVFLNLKGVKYKKRLGNTDLKIAPIKLVVKYSIGSI